MTRGSADKPEKLDKKMIIIMSELAAYDKYYAAKDKRMSEYFRHDYVYRQNIGMRFFTIIGSLIVILFYFMHRIIIDGLDILDITQLASDLLIAGIFFVVVQVIYSALGSFIYGRQYNEAQERISTYVDNMNKLSRRKERLERGEIEERRRPRRGGSDRRYEPDDY